MGCAGAKYNIFKTLTFVLIFFLNQTLANKVEILNVAPNLIFVVVLCASLVENSSSNIYYSFGFGLLFDFFNSKIMCIYAITFVVIPFVLSEIYHTYFENMISVKTVFAIIGCFAYSFLFAVFFGLRGVDFFAVLIKVSVVEFVYNSLLAVVVLFLYKRIVNVRKSAWRV